MVHQENYYSRGKILLFGEYFVLFGAKALAMPTLMGQHLFVQTKRSYDPKLKWESYGVDGKKWFDVEMDLWHFRSKEQLDDHHEAAHKTLQTLLSQVRRENPHFLREKQQIEVRTKLEFPLEWGLGSSSSLISNISEWANINPYDLGATALGGSGYDIACARASGPIVYQKDMRSYEREPICQSIDFNPAFKDQLYFVYLGKKEKTSEHLEKIEKDDIKISLETIASVNTLIENVIACKELSEFNELIIRYENLASELFHIPRAKKLYFQDYWGEVKSLGAWGGDFVLVTSDQGEEKTREYFLSKGYSTFLTYHKLIHIDGDSARDRISTKHETNSHF